MVFDDILECFLFHHSEPERFQFEIFQGLMHFVSGSENMSISSKKKFGNMQYDLNQENIESRQKNLWTNPSRSDGLIKHAQTFERCLESDPEFV